MVLLVKEGVNFISSGGQDLVGSEGTGEGVILFIQEEGVGVCLSLTI